MTILTEKALTAEEELALALSAPPLPVPLDTNNAAVDANLEVLIEQSSFFKKD